MWGLVFADPLRQRIRANPWRVAPWEGGRIEFPGKSKGVRSEGGGSGCEADFHGAEALVVSGVAGEEKDL